MLSEISQTEIYTVWSHLNVESKNPYKLIQKEIRFEVTGGRGGTGGRRKGVKSHKLAVISKSWDEHIGTQVWGTLGSCWDCRSQKFSAQEKGFFLSLIFSCICIKWSTWLGLKVVFHLSCKPSRTSRSTRDASEVPRHISTHSSGPGVQHWGSNCSSTFGTLQLLRINVPFS